MNMQKIGNFICQLRKERQWTQKQLSEQLGLSPKTISKWECGGGLPELIYMEALCELFQISLDELIMGERMGLEDFLSLLKTNQHRLLVEIEGMQLKFRLFKLYGIEIEKIEISHQSAGALIYIVSSQQGKYVVKYPSDNEMNHIENEPPLCFYLQNQGFKVSQFIKNQQNEWISLDEYGRRFHVQTFMEGITCQIAPAFLFDEASKWLGKIHATLKNYPRLPEGIGPSFFSARTPAKTLISLQHSYQLAIEQGDSHIALEIFQVMELIKSVPLYTFEADKFSYGNTHGDYQINQWICDDSSIVGIVDWSSACTHPYVWEVMRSYLFMNDGEMNLKQFEDYFNHYLKYHSLNTYDIINAGHLFHYFLSVCDFYSQYYRSLSSQRSIYLHQAYLSKKILTWMNVHMHELDILLKNISQATNGF